ncbi:MAG: hypothetical protein ACKV22_10460 [Bryobacteraceae bacterium]
MRFPGRVLLLLAGAGVSLGGSMALPDSAVRTGFSFAVEGKPAGSWPSILAVIGLRPGPVESSAVVVLGPAAEASPRWLEMVNRGTYLIAEGQSLAAEMFGFRAMPQRVRVRRLQDARSPVAIIWEKDEELLRFQVPDAAKVFVREKWTRAPLVAGLRRGEGAVLWVASSPGERGYERYPFLPHALQDLGFAPPFESRRLWAFFDSSYRLRVDTDYFAKRWRASGIAGLHVAAWHFFEPDEARDAYLKRLISSCHRNGIAVYAWLELPHVSEKFWLDHPHWREKTADLRDAHLDWRKLMNLSNRDCFRAAVAGVKSLVIRFDWDGVNLGELYFESLEGAANASRFTPMNDDVRAEFRGIGGFDPAELFKGKADSGRLERFLEYRSRLAGRMQDEWLTELEACRRERPHLDVVLTHVDDQIDGRMKAAIGADAAAVMPLAQGRGFTFLVEDPATVWHLSPERYREMALRYARLAVKEELLGVDINVVERYQDVYPTKQQTGVELLQLIRAASVAFRRVALYFERSLQAEDLSLLPSAAAVVDRVRESNGGWEVDSAASVHQRWRGAARVNGKPWPVGDGEFVLLPAGGSRVEPSPGWTGTRIWDFSGELESAELLGNGACRIVYTSQARAIARVRRPVLWVEIDGVAAPLSVEGGNGEWAVLLPNGKHRVVLQTEDSGIRASVRAPRNVD